MSDLKVDFSYTENDKVLVYGYGNPGRQDDGYGHLMALEVDKWNIPNVEVDFNYQLNVEDALDISEKDIVIFVDASIRIEEDYKFSVLEPSEELSYSTHAMPPNMVLALCHKMYQKYPKTYVLELRGVEWGMAESLSSEGERIFGEARKYLETILKK